jgi:hypothetical protein
MDDEYSENANQAGYWLQESFRRTDPEASTECLATAQVYATLAVVDALDRLTDSHNGWKDLGK